MQTRKIAYNRDISSIFRHFSAKERAILFDSGFPLQQAGQYDFFSACPSKVIEFDGIDWKLSLRGKKTAQKISFSEAKDFLSQKWMSSTNPLPFCGGWMGYANYELAHFLDKKLPELDSASSSPVFYAGYYDWVVIQDHQQKSALIAWQDEIDSLLLDDIMTNLKDEQPQDNTFTLVENFNPDTTKTSYLKAIDHIEQYLLEGDCYQVNYTQRYSTKYRGNPYNAYEQLRTAVPSPFSSYFNGNGYQILSISPERFLSAKGRSISSKPIKGTIKRMDDPELDNKQIHWLKNSVKDKAENLMIVDLIRNDLGKFCETSSIHVDKLFDLETYKNVHHLVSTITGTISDDYCVWDVFFGAFPGGSITGAPKTRACQIINELEENKREIYCGSMFYASNNGIFDSNISIRTLLCKSNEIYAWAGGGIVKDSIAEREYEECYDKIQVFLEALENPSTGN